MPFVERYKWSGVSGEIRGHTGRWTWIVARHHTIIETGTAWTYRTAWRRMAKCAEKFEPRALEGWEASSQDFHW